MDNRDVIKGKIEAFNLVGHYLRYEYDGPMIASEIEDYFDEKADALLKQLEESE